MSLQAAGTLREHVLQSHFCFEPRVHMGAVLNQP